MQDARRVRGGQRRQHLVQNRPHLWLRQRPRAITSASVCPDNRSITM